MSRGVRCGSLRRRAELPRLAGCEAAFIARAWTTIIAVAIPAPLLKEMLGKQAYRTMQLFLAGTVGMLSGYYIFDEPLRREAKRVQEAMEQEKAASSSDTQGRRAE